MELSQAQTDAVNKAKDWLVSWQVANETAAEEEENKTVYIAGNNNRGWFVIAGYAGTGKSTSVKQLVEALKLEAAYMTYTGKAALVLQRYGNLPATTIHSRIYKLRHVRAGYLTELANKRDMAQDDTERKALQAEITELQKPRFILRDRVEEEGPTFTEDIIILDECSMVGREMLDDLLTFRKPIIALGDPGQLPPIGDKNKPADSPLFAGAPDVMLTEIHRQAAGNPIIDFSMRARQQISVPHHTRASPPEDTRAVCYPLAGLTQRMLFEEMQAADITICWRNETRHFLNNLYRQGLGFHEKSPLYPIAGDKIVCRKNSKEKGLLNGLFAEVVEVLNIFDASIDLMIRTELQKAEEEPFKISALRAKFDAATNPEAMKQARPWELADHQQFEFGYAITCHTAQGSQWPKVLLLDAYHLNDKRRVLQWAAARQDRARWLYTGITRAAQQLTILHA